MTSDIFKKFKKHFNARMLYYADNLMDRIYGRRKRSIYGALPSTVVEIGPGAGANLRYYAPYTRVIAVEPNPAMLPYLKRIAGKFNLDLHIKSIQGERVDLPDECVDAVIGTLVLCSVQEPTRVLAEIRRILRPGGKYYYLEHVADSPGTSRRRLQEQLGAVWSTLFDGCHLDRHTHRDIQAAGFSEVAMDCFTLESRWMPFAPHIFGTAVK